MVRDFTNKIKALWGRMQENLLLIVVIVLVALLAFGLGRLSVFYGEKDEFRVLYPNGQSASALQGAVGLMNSGGEPSLPPQIAMAGGYVASRTTGTYFFPWCPLALRISSENRVYFSSRAAAEAAGYHPGRCNGL